MPKNRSGGGGPPNLSPGRRRQMPGKQVWPRLADMPAIGRIRLAGCVPGEILRRPAAGHLRLLSAPACPAKPPQPSQQGQPEITSAQCSAPKAAAVSRPKLSRLGTTDINIVFLQPFRPFPAFPTLLHLPTTTQNDQDRRRQGGREAQLARERELGCGGYQLTETGCLDRRPRLVAVELAARKAGAPKLFCQLRLHIFRDS